MISEPQQNSVSFAIASSGNKKKGRLAPALPLRHVGNIVIWEGNYKSDTLIFGPQGKNLTVLKEIIRFPKQLRLS